MPIKYQRVQESLQKKQTRFQNKTILSVIELNKQANEAIKTIIQKTYEKYSLPILTDGKPDAALTTSFMNQRVKNKEYGNISRLNIMKLEIRAVVMPLFIKRDKLIERSAKVSYQSGYYRNAWAIQNEAKVKIKWPKLKDKQIIGAVNENPLSIFKSREL